MKPEEKSQYLKQTRSVLTRILHTRLSFRDREEDTAQTAKVVRRPVSREMKILEPILSAFKTQLSGWVQFVANGQNLEICSCLGIITDAPMLLYIDLRISRLTLPVKTVIAS